MTSCLTSGCDDIGFHSHSDSPCEVWNKTFLQMQPPERSNGTDVREVKRSFAYFKVLYQSNHHDLKKRFEVRFKEPR